MSLKKITPITKDKMEGVKPIDRRSMKPTCFDKTDPPEVGLKVMKLILQNKMSYRDAQRYLQEHGGVTVGYTTIGSHIRKIKKSLTGHRPTIIVETDNLKGKNEIQNRLETMDAKYASRRMPLATRNEKGIIKVNAEVVPGNALMEIEEMKQSPNIAPLTLLHAINLQTRIANDIMARDPHAKLDMNAVLQDADMVTNSIPHLEKRIMAEYNIQVDLRTMFLEFVNDNMVQNGI